MTYTCVWMVERGARSMCQTEGIGCADNPVS